MNNIRNINSHMNNTTTTHCPSAPSANPSFPLVRPAGRNDQRLLRLRRDLGLEGYAVYSMLRELLSDSGGSVAADYSLIAYDLRTDEALVRGVAEDYALFLIDGGRIAMLPSTADYELRRKRSEAGRKGMRRRWAGHRAITDDNKTITNSDEKKEKENLPPAPPIKEKDKEKAEERKEISLSDKNAANAQNGDMPAVQHGDGAEETDKAFCRRFLRYWNESIRRSGSRLKPVCILSAQRRRHLERLRRVYDSNQIAWLVWKACRSPYLNARDGRLRQPADLDWMLASDERIVKIIEGNL